MSADKSYPKRSLGKSDPKPDSFDMEGFKAEILSTIQSAIRETVDELRHEFIERCEKIEQTCVILKCDVENVKKDSGEMKDKLAILEQQNESLKKYIFQLRENVEDKTNRQLRKTLTFKNIPEKPDETWEDTTKVVAKTIERVSGNEISYDDAYNMLERCHRAKALPNRSGPRPIFAAIIDWRDSESITEHFCKKPRDINIYCEQKYGPITTKRRQKALLKRKEMKEKWG